MFATVVTVIFCAVVIIYYLWEAEEHSEDIGTYDVFWMIWAVINLLKVLFTW